MLVSRAHHRNTVLFQSLRKLTSTWRYRIVFADFYIYIFFPAAGTSSHLLSHKAAPKIRVCSKLNMKLYLQVSVKTAEKQQERECARPQTLLQALPVPEIHGRWEPSRAIINTYPHLQLILLFTVPTLTVTWFYSVQSSMFWGSFSSDHQIQAVRMLGYKLKSYTCSYLVKILSSKSWSAFAIKQTNSVYKVSVQTHWEYVWKSLLLINRSKPITAEKKVSRTMPWHFKLGIDSSSCLFPYP